METCQPSGQQTLVGRRGVWALQAGTGWPEYLPTVSRHLREGRVAGLGGLLSTPPGTIDPWKGAGQWRRCGSQ